MPTTQNIYPVSYTWINKTNADWQTARDSGSGDNAYNSSPSKVGIIQERDFIFYRTYVSFDLGELPVGATIDSITISIKSDTDLIYDIYVAFAGTNQITTNRANYSLYLNELIENSALSSVRILNDKQYYTSGTFDLNTYNVGNQILTVGLIDKFDFDNVKDSVTNEFLIDLGVNAPYLTVTYTVSSGYTNNLMGVSSANISSVQGVLSANISKINVI